MLLLTFLADSSAQINGICSCSPSSFTFTFDFALSCSKDLLLNSGGIQESTCNITPKSDRNITDIIPVVVTSIQVLELNRSSTILNQTDILGNFVSGDSFLYTSLTASGVYAEADIPGQIQVSVTALNTDGKDILMIWVAQYTNACDFYPVFPLNGTTAWTILVSFRPIACKLTYACKSESFFKRNVCTNNSLSAFNVSFRVMPHLLVQSYALQLLKVPLLLPPQ